MNQTKQQTQKAPKIKVGSIVKWTGQGRGGSKDHVGKVVRLDTNDRGEQVAVVHIERRHKKTGAMLKPDRYTPRVSALSLAK